MKFTPKATEFVSADRLCSKSKLLKETQVLMKIIEMHDLRIDFHRMAETWREYGNGSGDFTSILTETHIKRPTKPESHRDQRRSGGISKIYGTRWSRMVS
jgi:hypothetical protein